MPDPTLVLGSQSSQRHALLASMMGAGRIRICPPRDKEEAGFDGLTAFTEIQQRLFEIAWAKNLDVQQQCRGQSGVTILTADTIVVVRHADAALVLGKPDGDHWEERVEAWFRDYYSERSHQVITQVCLRFPDGTCDHFAETTEVRFRSVRDDLLKWYIQTGEPLGKAGGYGVQSAGSLFISAINGSLSNVIGLPLEGLWECLQARQFLPSGRDHLTDDRFFSSRPLDCSPGSLNDLTDFEKQGS